MKNSKKALLVFLCIVALVACSVYATLAYFTDSEAAINTFSVGQVHIDLDEKDVDKDAYLLDNKTYEGGVVRDKANEYHLIPGSTYDKDPTVHVAANSEDAWIFVKVENGIADIEAATVKDGYTNIADQITANHWTELEGVENVYYQAHTKSAAVVDYVVFKNFKIDGDKTVNVPTAEETTLPTNLYDLSDYEEATVTVTAYAIQMAGFEGKPNAAWAAGHWS